MFKQLKASVSTGSVGSGTAGGESTVGSGQTSSSIRPSSSSPSSISSNTVSAPSSTAKGLTRSQSALQLLQQQRRLNRRSAFAPPTHVLTSSATATTVTAVVESEHSEAPTKRGKRTVKPIVGTKAPLPITARKKIKTKAAVPAVVGAEEEEEEEGKAPVSETLPSAADETPVVQADDTEAAEEGEEQEMDAEGEEDPDLANEQMPASSVEKDSEAHDPVEHEETSAGPSEQNVVVCVRVRPASADVGNVKETAKMWSLDGQLNRVVPTEQHPTLAKRSAAASSSDPAVAEDGAYDFRFDALVLPSQSSDGMYDARIAPVVDAVIKGYNGTVFAYGQTGSGKTYTMSGSPSEKGVIPKAVDQIFDSVQKTSSREFLLRVSYLEIYNETLNDLLAVLPSGSSAASSSDPDGRPSSPTKGGSSHVVTGNGTASSSLRMFESGGRVQIQGLREEIVTTAEEVLDLLERGQRARHQAATDWNERSSRSHCVFILTVESREKANGVMPSAKAGVRLSQLNLIDLAGSERAASEKERRKEGAFINKSLLTLGTVIAKLSEQCSSGREEAHIPYRDSKLTRLLQTSLGGNARVAVVCTLSARKEHAIESLSTLRFGQRCKMVVTRAKQGSVMDDKALIARYRRELEKLRGQLEAGANTAVVQLPVSSGEDPSIKALQDEKEKAERDVRDMNAKRDELKKQIEHLTKLILTGKDVEAGSVRPNADAEMEEDEADKSRRIRASRRSDLGTSSPSKRSAARFASPHVLMPLRSSAVNQENFNTPQGKPFAMESELAQLRKNLSKALAAKQASEEARRKEVQLWQAKVTELEEANKEQEEELDEAEEAFNKLKGERDQIRAKIHEEQEANRLLKLVAKSRTAESTEEQRRILSESEAKVKQLQAELEQAVHAQQELQARQEERANVMRAEMEALREQVKQAQRKSGSDERIAELEKELESLRDEARQASDKQAPGLSTQDADHAAQMEPLREELRKATEENERLTNEMRQSMQERNQEDAERDFAALVQGGDEEQAVDALRKELKQVKERLAEQTQENEELKSKASQSKPLPVPSLSSTGSSPSMSEDLRSTMEKQLKRAEERCKALETQVESLKKETLTMRNIPIPSPPSSATFLASSPSSSTSSAPSGRSSTLVELQIESDIQKSRIASLERQLSEARARLQDASGGSVSMPGSPLKWSSSSLLASRSNPGTPVKRSGAARLDNVREEDIDGDETIGLLQPGPFSSLGIRGGAGLSRGGSLREYKRYSASSASGMGMGGDLALPARSTDELERQLRTERNEIERLNGVISTQRSIMADLEASVATWKRRLRLQQDIIAKLVESGGQASPSLLAETNSMVVGETPAVGHEQQLPSYAKTSTASKGTSSADLKRTSSTSSTASPYYGAHIYNRPPVPRGGAAQGLGLGSSSPSKGASWLATMPGVRPDPLPLPDYAVSAGLSSPNGKAARRRKTIEHEIESLRGSPRVENTKSRLLEPAVQHQQSPGQRSSRPLPVPGSPAKLRVSKDWYI